MQGRKIKGRDGNNLAFSSISLVNLALIDSINDYSFSVYVKFAEEITFLTPLYAHILVCARG